MRLLRKPRFFLFGTFFLACLPLGCSHAPAEFEEEHPAPVEIQNPRQLMVKEWTELLGTTQPLPNHGARISAPIEGRVLAVLPEAGGKPIVEGQLVKKGDVIVRLDAAVVQANRNRAAAAQGDLKELAKQAGFALKLAEIEVRRLQELSRTSSTNGRLPLVSSIELEKADYSLQDARSKQLAAEQKLEAGKEELNALDEQLKLHSLTAPISGRLGRLQVVPGQTIAPGTTIAEVVDLDDAVDVLCFVPPHIARLLKLKEQPAHIARAEPAPGKAAPKGDKGADPAGTIEFISEQAEPETGNFAVKVRFPNRDLRLRGNTVVHVRVMTHPEKSCLTIPEAAVMEDQDPPAVIVVENLGPKTNDEGKEEQIGKARKLQVILGIRDREFHVVEVLRFQDPEKKTDVKVEDANVVIKGAHGLQTDDKIKIEEEEDE